MGLVLTALVTLETVLLLWMTVMLLVLVLMVSR